MFTLRWTLTSIKVLIHLVPSWCCQWVWSGSGELKWQPLVFIYLACAQARWSVRTCTSTPHTSFENACASGCGLWTWCFLASTQVDTGVLDVHGKLLWYLIKSKRSPTNASNIYLSHELPFTLVKGGKEIFINTLSSHKKRRTKGHIAESDIVCDVGEVLWCHQAHFSDTAGHIHYTFKYNLVTHDLGR